MLANPLAESKHLVVAKKLVLLAVAAKLQILAAMHPLAAAASRACSRDCSTSTTAAVTPANRLAESKHRAAANPAALAVTKTFEKPPNRETIGSD
jgi:predicted ATPase with chaperone activity